MSEISQGEFLRYMERQDRIMSSLSEDLKQVSETLTSNTVLIKNIDVQTTKTNGRVTKLEEQKEIDDQKNEERFDKIERNQTYVVGFVAGVAILGGATWGIIRWIYPDPVKTVSEETFNKVLEAYNQAKLYEEENIKN